MIIKFILYYSYCYAVSYINDMDREIKKLSGKNPNMFRLRRGVVNKII